MTVRVRPWRMTSSAGLPPWLAGWLAASDGEPPGWQGFLPAHNRAYLREYRRGWNDYHHNKHTAR